jgi:16S rRNA (adenine1518-N6/adenine1519-N6)-dimethyltransferase
VTRRKLGQHYLIHAKPLERIAAAVCPQPEPLVIEIGPGKGALTRRLLARAERVVAIEIDAWLVDHLRREFAGEPRLEVVQGDVLAADLGQWGPAAVAGNLPYYITSPILEKTVEARGAIRRAVYLVQKEVAERVAAGPGSRDYGYLTVAVRLFFDAELLFEVKRGAFHPPPKVDSAVLRLTPTARAAALGIADTAHFLRFAGRCFRQKRKTVRNNLAGEFPRELLDAMPEAAARAEQLNIESLAELYRRLVG